ncbi:MAG: glycosyl hydrolase, partial [Planctomycetota bacterium]
YTDLLNPHAVKAFVKHTYDGYRKALRRRFKTIPGIFTDEPQWGSPVPWSTELPGFFKEQKGYELLPELFRLVRETPESARLRYDFFHAATELFVRSFTRQLFDWCEKKGIALTGHFNGEDRLASQMANVGAVMPHYEFMQIPGIDHLSRRIGDPLLCKQVSSVAHQFGGRRALSEMFGCSGWDVSFEELKWIAEWQFVQGIDLVCPHLSLYSLRGCRKRDYPPSLHVQQPWWDDYKLLNDYFARLTYMLTRGKHVADVLVVHTIESAWAEFDPDESKAVDRLDRKLVDVAKTLLGMHVDFDFGDETILAKYGRVSKGSLRVKSGEYQVAVVPPCTTLRSSTVRLLERFMDHKGTVLVVGKPPGRMDGRPSDEPAETLADAVHAGQKSLARELAKVVEPRIQVLDEDREDAAHIYVQQRDDRSQQIFFLANTSRETRTEATVRLPKSGRLERWDPATGEVEPLKTRKRGKAREAELTFEPMGSHLLVLHPRRRPGTVRARKRAVVRDIELNDAWQLERTEPNALTVDRCAYRVRDGVWSPPMPVLTVQDNLRHVPGSEVCEFRYSFHADFHEKLPEFVHLTVERPEAYDITMNGLPVIGPGSEESPTPDLGPWRDTSFRRLDVSHLVRPQDRNDVVLRCVVHGEEERRERIESEALPPAEKNRLRYGPEIESIYVLGAFHVRSQSKWKALQRRAVRTAGPFVLGDPWGLAESKDLVAQGLPFYAGAVRLSQQVVLSEDDLKKAKGATVRLDPPDAVVTKVHVNGEHAGTRAWRPYEFEVGDLLTAGRNDVTVELTGSCRNLLGPHHHCDGELYSVGPDSFRGRKSWTDRSKAPVETWTDEYNFVRFGLAGPVTLALWK